MALRGFKSNAIFTLFNIIGLVFSLTVIFIAIAYLNFETNYDKFHEKSDSIYRLARTLRSQDYSVIGFQNWNSSDAQEQIDQITKLAEIPAAKSATHFITTPDSEFASLDNKEITINDLLITNTPQSFVDIFTWDLIYGSFDSFSTNKNTVILTETVAKRLSSNQNILALVDNVIDIAGETFSVAAIIKDVPQNSHFNFSVAIHKEQIDYWGSHVYIEAENGYDQAAIESQINSNVASIFPNLIGNDTYKKHFVQPIADIHLKSNILYELKQPGNINYIWLVGGFAFLILGICIFNFSNFTLALKTKQSKTIGIKKVIGASKNSVIRQFVLEGILLAVVSLVIVSIILPIVVPIFNNFMEVSLEVNVVDNWRLYVLMLILSISIGVISSILPALNLSQKDAKSLFQDRLKEKGFQDFSVRKYLVISQFVIIIAITAISYFIQDQVDYIANKDLGFIKDNIVYAYTSADKLDVFQEQLKQIPEVEIVANGSSLAIGTFNQLTYKIEGNETVFDDANQLYMDYSALEAYGLDTTLPEALINNPEEQPRRTIINRTAAEKLAKVKNVTPKQLIGMTIISEPEYVDNEGNAGIPFTIDGIFEDINLFSLKEKIQPYFIVVSNRVRMNGTSIIAFKPGLMATGLDKVQTAYNKLNEPFPLEIQYLDTNYENLHAQDKQMGQLVFWLNGIAVFISLLGIIGITLLLVLGRTKEIGIRKVLGASVASILKISVKEYLVFITVASLIAWPIAYVVVENWLSNFAYRINVNHFAFLGISILILIGTAFVVGLVSYKAAVSNPVKALRTE